MGSAFQIIRRAFLRAPLLWVAVLGMALTVPAVTVDLLVDDHRVGGTLVGMLEGREGLIPWWQLGVSLSGDPQDTYIKRGTAQLPWWTSPQVRVAFYRPVALLTWLMDYALWPGAVWAMHLHSILWYGLTCFLAGVVLRTMAMAGVNRGAVAGAGARAGIGAAVYVLAALLYAVDDLHSVPVAWITNRGGLVAACCGFLALLAHARWRREGWKPGAVLAPLTLITALLAAEIGICIFAYFAAYALCLERGSLRSRLLSLVPGLTAIALWLGVYSAYGYGSSGSGLYLDPVQQPVSFLMELPGRMARLMSLQFGLPEILLYDLGQLTNAFVPSIPSLMVGAGLVWLIAAGVTRRDRETGFWAIGFVLASLPLAAGWPTGHTMIISGIGGCALVAHLTVFMVCSWPHLTTARRAGAGLVLGVTLAINAALSPAYLFYGTHAVGRHFAYLGFSAAPALGTTFDPELQKHEAIVLNAPNAFHGIMIAHERWRRGLPSLRYIWVMGSGDSDVQVRRIDENTLELTAEGGYLTDTFATHFRGAGHSIRSGETVRLHTLTMEVIEVTLDGRPAVVRARLDLSLEHPWLHYISWDGEDYAPVALPRTGECLLLPEGIYKGQIPCHRNE